MAPTEPALAHPDASVAVAPVIDIEAGVARLMGDRAIHLRVLARFLKDYRTSAAALRTALAANDAALARRLVHTLKGAAGMIEAGPLHGAALDLEDALRSEMETGEPLKRVETALGDVVRVLETMPLNEDGAPLQRPNS